MAPEEDVEDGQQGARPLDEVAGDQGAECEAGEQTRVQVADGHAAFRRGGAVAGVGMAQDAPRGEGARQAVEERTEEQDLVGDRLGVLGGQDGDDFRQDAANGAEDHHVFAAIAV